MGKEVVLKTTKEFLELKKASVANKIILPKNFVGNIFDLPNKLSESKLMEGVFSTYPAEKVKKYLEKRYGDAAIVCIIKGENDEDVFLIRTGDVDYNQKIIDKDMSLCGYFPSYVERRDNQRTIQYEPTYQNTVNEVVQDVEYIFHITPTNKIGKILKIGLTPKTNNKKFMYPDRIYFSLKEFYYEEWVDIIKEFYEEEFKSYKMGGRKEPPYKGTYTVLAIDTEKVKDCNFSYDPNAEDCVYTYDNIPPDAIEVVCEIEQENLEK